MVKPDAVRRSTIGRVRWQPPKSRFWIGSRRCCQRRTPSSASGASPCSTKCKVPPGLRTRCSSASAASTSGIVQSVHVDRAASNVLSRAGQRLTVESGSGDRHARRLEPFAGQLPTGIGRFDRGDARHGVRIERDVESRAEADLDDLAAQPLAGTPPHRCDGLHPAAGVQDVRQDSFAVDAHGGDGRSRLAGRHEVITSSSGTRDGALNQAAGAVAMYTVLEDSPPV